MNTLFSKRLAYKKLNLEHCTDDYVSWLNNPQVYRYLETGGNYNKEKLSEYLSEVVSKKDILFWAIHLKSNGKHIGNIKIDPVNSKYGLGEYGIMMGDTEEWGKGYAKEASKAIISHCFDNLKMRKITLGVVADNEAAVNLYKTLGFEIEGVYKRHGYYDGKWSDIIRMAIFNENYKGNE
ncbi:MAG: GNAT family protein [Pedobacter sp.]|uniref:GNAT family N-acetyltransferase n=1 Tax=Pedobacter sp. TaxID=1411316 RepID=UPI002806B599|nr:GNAT family protein [Pedobacter sp.]MDQ8004327.1 GNAT family protein [Pedobacter sp.]